MGGGWVVGVGILCISVSAEAAPLRYQATRGDTWHYYLELRVETGETVETWGGILIYTVKSATEDEVEFDFSDELIYKRQSSSGQPMIPIPFRPPMFLAPGAMLSGKKAEPRLTISAQGVMREGQSLTPLPYLLGYKELLVFERLPEEAVSEWTVEEQVHVVLKEDLGPVLAPLWMARAAREVTRLSATEKSCYKVTGSGDVGIHIEKNVQLKTDQQAADRPRFEVTGGGLFTFDPSLGRVRKLNFQYLITENEELKTSRARATMSVTSWTPQEVSQWRQKREADRAAAQAKIAELKKPRPLLPGEKEALLEELRTENFFRQQRALERFSQAEREEPAEAVCQAILPYLRHENQLLRQRAAQALRVWATPSAQESLLQAAADKNLLVAGEAMLALARVPSPAVIEFLAERLVWPRQASEALKLIGPQAEDIVLRQLFKMEPAARMCALDVLASIGTEKSLKILKEWPPNAADRQLIEKTILSIQTRLQGETSVPDSTSDDRPQ